MKNKKNITKRREFLKKAGLVSAGAIGASTLAAPYAYAATNPIKWRLQTYSGAPLGAHVVLPQIEAFNKAAHGEMEIELYYADQLVPTDELFRECKLALLMLYKVMMQLWDLQLIYLYLVDIFHLQLDTA